MNLEEGLLISQKIWYIRRICLRAFHDIRNFYHLYAVVDGTIKGLIPLGIMSWYYGRVSIEPLDRNQCVLKTFHYGRQSDILEVFFYVHFMI